MKWFLLDCRASIPAYPNEYVLLFAFLNESQIYRISNIIIFMIIIFSIKYLFV